MKKKLFSWLAMLCFMIPCVLGLSACGKEPPAMTGYKIIVNQQLIAESRTINVTYGDEIEWSAIALYNDNSTAALSATDITVTDADEVVGTKPSVGSYEVKFKYLEYGEYTVTVNVNPKQLIIPTATNLVYSGAAQTTELVGFDDETMTVSGDLTVTTANTYSVEVALKDTTNYCWVDGSTGSQTVEFLVAKAKIAKPTKVEKTYTYTGSPITLELENFIASSMSISGNVETNAGTYTAVVTLEDTTNYEWKNAAGSEIEWTIEKAQGTAPASAPTALSGTYDPAKTLADYTPATHYVWADDTIVPTVAVSEYAVIYNPDSQNYTDYEMTYTLNIAKAQLVVPTVTGDALSFDETAKTVELAHFDAAKMSVEGNTETEVGSHTAVVTITDGNYEFVGGETTADIAWSIGKGTPTITIPYDYSKQFDGTTINLPRYTMPATLETDLMYTGCTVVYKNSTGTEVDFADITNPGSYSMTVSTPETDHYFAASVEKSFQIYYYLPAEYSNEIIGVEIEDVYNQYYDGSAKTPAVTVEKYEYDEYTHEVLSTTPLVLGVDYTLEYKNNVNYYDKALVVITGKGAYKGEIIESFNIGVSNMFESITVNGNAVDLSTNSVTTTSNPAGHTITLTLKDIYEDALDYGHFEYYASDVNRKYVCPTTVLSGDTLTFVVPNEARVVTIPYSLSGTHTSITLTISDLVDNSAYLTISGTDVWVDAENIFKISEDATDTTSTTQQIITATLADSSNLTMMGSWTYVAESLNIAADDTSFTIQVNDGTETKTLTYQVIDYRPGFYKAYVNFMFIELQDDSVNEYLSVPANKTFTFATISDMTTLDLYLNDLGNIDKFEILFDGAVKYTELSGRDNYQGLSNIRFEMVIVDDYYEDNVIVEEAGTYTLRFYLTETTYEDWYVVVGEIVEPNYITMVYDGETYQLNDTFEGGILAKYDIINETISCMYVYVGEIDEAQTSIALSLSSDVTGFYDASKQLIADTSNLTLQVESPAEGARYAMVYVCINDEYMPLYVYLCDSPADIEIKFANTSLEFNFAYTEVDNGGTIEYHFGDFVATSITPDENYAIYLNATVTKEQIGLMTQAIIDDELYDTTVSCEIAFEYMMAMVNYNIHNEYVASPMMSYPENVNLQVIQDVVAPGADQTYTLMFAIADFENFMSGTYIVSIRVV